MATGMVAHATKDCSVVAKVELHLLPERNIPTAIATLKDSRSVCLCGHDGSVVVWNAESQEVTQKLRISGAHSLLPSVSTAPCS